MSRAYYNENDPYCVQWLRNLIAKGLIADGDVDGRDIRDVKPEDLRGYRQVHFFAGIGGWSRALRLAQWPDDVAVWTGSCPCQPFSTAGKRLGTDDPRHLWPEFRRLVYECGPPIVFGEQVAAAKVWLDAVFVDLEAFHYACGAAVIPAAGVGAPHRRDRIWFVANAGGAELRQQSRRGGRANGKGAAFSRDNGPQRVFTITNGQGKHAGAQHAEMASAQEFMAHAARDGRRPWRPSDAAESQKRRAPHRGGVNGAPPNAHQPIIFGEPSARQFTEHDENAGDGDCGWRSPWSAQPGVRLLAHGIPARVAKLRALGNAIVPQVAAEFIAASREAIASM